MKRLLFISQYFDPETFRGNDVAYHLASQGWKVTVVAATPNYPQGRFYKGYGWFRRRVETKNGVRIIRVPVIPRGSSRISLALNYFSYAVAASVFVAFHLLRHRYDLCFVQQLSPVMMSWPGILFKRLTHKPLVTWMLDLWPESLQAAGGISNQLVLNLFGQFARWEYRASDLLLTSSRPFSDIASQRGADPSKIKYFPQWADAVTGDTTLPVPQLARGFRVVCAGNVGDAQDFESLVEAARLLPDDGSVRFVIVGTGRKLPWVEEQVRRYGLQRRLDLLGRFPAQAVPAILSQADLLMLSLKDEPAFRLTAPAKIAAYMAAGRPVVGMMNGAGADLIRESGCGVVVNASSPKELVSAIMSLRSESPDRLQAYGENGHRFYLANFEKHHSLAVLQQLLSDLCH